MRKVSLLFMLLLLASFLFSSETIRFEDSWGSAGFSLNQRSSSGVELNFSIDTFTLEDANVDGEAVQNVLLPQTYLQNEAGAPNLPGNGRFLALPQGADAEVRIVSVRTETYSNIELAAAPRIPLDTDDGPLDYTKNKSIYDIDEFYPASPVIMGEKTMIRGVDAVMVGITPFQYNPVTKELIVYRDLEVEVNFIGGNGKFGADNLRSRWWDPILADTFLNFASLPVIDYSATSRTREGYDYLVISPDDPTFLAWADSIKVFRTKQGISTIVKTTTEIGGNTAGAIEGYINDIMDTNTGWDPAPSGILLLGDYGTTGNTIVSPIYNNYCVSDNIYADVFGNNMMPDVILARMTAQNETHLETMVTKFLDHERNPPVNPEYYANPITALGYQTERWFQICSEAVAGFWEVAQGKTVNRINAVYSGSPQSGPWSTNQNTSTVLNYFGPNGLGYIPATPGQVNCTWNGSASDVVNGINNGAFMLQHRDHGSETGWGEPAYQSSNINSQTNTDLTFVLSINCLTGKYNIGGECFTEKFHRYKYNGENSGALGLIAASEVSYSFVNDTYVWGLYDNLWPGFMPDYGTTPPSRDVLPAFGNAAGKYFLMQSNWPYNTNNKAVTYNLFHHHGDAFMTVYSEVPQNLSVTHDPVILSGITNFTVTADAGAFIAFSVDGVIIGTAEATGSPVSVTIDPQIPPTEVVAVITKQNYYRYETVIPVIPPGGPYVVFNEFVINDASGNDNGMLDYDENINLDMTVNNVGSEDATDVDVTITSTDQYVTIIDGSENFGDVTANTLATIEDAFEIVASDDVPDGHMIDFVMSASAQSTWESYFSIEVHAPSLSAGNISINDTAGNSNGRLDPGETVILTIPTENSGSAVSPSATGILTCSNQGLTIEDASYEIGEIEDGSSLNALFTVTADAGMIIGTPLELVYEAVAGEYNCQADYSIVVGLILEDFESNSFDSFDWQFGGNGNWTISTDAQEGMYSAKSAVISHNQTTSIYLETTVLADGELSFFKKVSSESNWDYLRFYIDNTELDSWSGTIGWSQETYDITAGDHTLKWEYDKDGSVSSGSDCAWIDYIVFPPMATGALGTVSGTITDSATGLTIEGADIASMTTSGANGTYTFEMMPGTYSLMISHDDYYDYLAEDVVVEENVVTTLDVALVPLPDLDPPANPSAELQDFNDVFVSWEPPGGAPVALWNQMDNPSTAGISAQDFEASYDQYDAMGADDFIVPAGETWSIFEIDILSFYSDGGGPCDLANVRFYADNGGIPGDVLHEFLDVEANPDETGNLFCTIPDTEFTEGTYWLSIQGRMDYSSGGQWYWTRQMAPAVESEFFWQNPEDGFETGFTTWSIASEVWPAEPDINLSFVIYGTTTSEAGVTTVCGNRNSVVSSKTAKAVNRYQQQGRLSTPDMSAVNEAYIQSPQEDTSRSLLGYKIYRNGSVIYDSLDPLVVTYLDVALDAGVYEYGIVAVYDEGDSDPAPIVTAEVLLPAPADAAASMQGSNVFVTWSSPAEARDIDSYNVYRDGILYSEEISSTFFIDIAAVSGETYVYNITTMYDGGWESEYSNDAEITITGAGGELIPLETSLEGNYPNPFNPTTTIKFGLNEDTKVNIHVYNIKGEKVRTLVNDELEAGYHGIEWNGRDDSGKNSASGVYFYKMKAGNVVETKKMILMK